MIENIRGIHVELTNICTLKCPGCPRTRFIDQWPQHWQNYSLDIATLSRFIDIDLNNRRIKFCGNYGDPLYHPDLIQAVKTFKKRGAGIIITTNGSYKKKEWWQELAAELDDKDQIQFSVDGTPESFTTYRINADWESIRIGMDVIAQSSCSSVWKYIPFSFNQNDIDTVRQLSQEIGLKEFKVELSDRFDEKTQTLMPQSSLLGERFVPQTAWKNTSDQVQVDPKCHLNREHFITAQGYYSPCCYVADHRFYYKTVFGKNKQLFDISTSTMSQILGLESTVNFYNQLDQHPVCHFNCPKTAG